MEIIDGVVLEEYSPENVISLCEHSYLSDEDAAYFIKQEVDFCETAYEGIPKYLGICSEESRLRASYYIGAEWIDSSHAVVVTPKCTNVDYVEMFATALKHSESSSYFSKFYGMDFSGEKIATNAHLSMLTPMLVIHYLSLIKKLLKVGLRRDYILREENLHSKIKGKIVITRNIKLNNISKRGDRTYCSYQEYTVDTTDNRILKKALHFSKTLICALKDHKLYPSLMKELNSAFAEFESVGDDVEVREIKRCAGGKVYSSYADALKVAQMILKRCNYSLSDVGNTNDETVPFWIDMARLYEVYVYSKLVEAYGSDNIKFQVEGYRKTAVDFIKLDEQVIIDTKYKPHYLIGNRGIVDDVRQISAYARDEKILSNFGEYNDIAPCLIIYPDVTIEPDEEGDQCNKVVKFSEDSILTQSSPIRGFRKFYKLSIPLPQL
ncbi:MAG: hypothetical protein R3Y68_09135 [Rikenellaceae bacterium]